jgi:hypothetical protein
VQHRAAPLSYALFFSPGTSLTAQQCSTVLRR